jgi:hypothetical protein
VTSESCFDVKQGLLSLFLQQKSILHMSATIKPMKLMIYVGASIGGLIGGYIPVLFWHAGALSGWSLVGGLIGTIAGIYPGYKLGQMME